ncbi:MAG: hypothetical protein KUG77_10385 [Nannocystaceae bacterium]|nr:hypothetical protein [Nannocystaceae bacterium]
MLPKQGLLALAALAAVAGCNESFECAADTHCELDGVAGFCESIGHCSFPDEACDSGRRFGSLAGTLSNQCVPPAEDGATSSDASTASAVESSGTASTSMNMTSSPTGDPVGSSSSTDTSGGSSGEGPILPCTVLYEDSFPGDAIDPTWLVQGDPVVLGGAARFAINPGASGTYEKLIALGGSRFDLSEGSVTLELESVPQILRTQGTLSFEGPKTSVVALWESGGIRPLVAGKSVDHSGMTLPWVRVAFTTGAEGTSRVVFSESEDGMDWVEVATAEDVPFDASDTQVQLTAGSYDDFAIPQEFAVRWISICGDPSGI